MKDRWLAIVNLTAGKGRAAGRWPVLADTLHARGIHFDVATTTGPGSATEIARSAAANFDGLLAVGGDGTVHEIVNGLPRSQAPILAVAPYGTGNDWARGLGVGAAPQQLADLLVTRQTRMVNVGEVSYQVGANISTRRFINGVGLGLDAAVLEGLPSGGPPALAYLRGTLEALRHFRAVETVISSGLHRRQGRYLLVYAGIGTYAGGGMRLAPRAGRHDGRLYLSLVAQAPMLQILALIPRLYRGTLDRSRLVQSLAVERFQIETGLDVRLEADGQLLGYGPASCRVLDERLAVIAARAAVADNDGSSTTEGLP